MNPFWPLKRFLRRFGFDIVRYDRNYDRFVGDPDFTPEDLAIIESVKQYTLTSAADLLALIQAVRYIVKNDISGDFVECGVWKGGSMMAAAEALLELGAPARELYLYDTYEGMPRPSEIDMNLRQSAIKTFNSLKTGDNSSNWVRCPVEEVEKNMRSTGYDEKRIHYIKGLVEETIPGTVPERIALLRLDTDFYKSTRHELIHLYPRLARGGILIVDDYGAWYGARKAVDEYLENNGLRLFLARISKSARICVKVD